ncbi:MAG: hypothetical protein IPK97_17390 [Ahniella sp.]|nr:hypothetical protein [Ahniella sp.]
MNSLGQSSPDADPHSPGKLASDEWLLRRSLFAVPGYLGVDWQHPCRRSRLPSRQGQLPTTHEMAADGQLRPLP